MKEVFGEEMTISDYDKFWNEILNELDINKDGKISFDEFKKMMLDEKNLF
jgi:Ca2+-binding EF-hand superfamily protein